jgi:hypothetical protein
MENFKTCILYLNTHNGRLTVTQPEGEFEEIEFIELAAYKEQRERSIKRKHEIFKLRSELSKLGWRKNEKPG